MCDYSPFRERAMTVLDDKTWCDPCIAPLVKALNDAGLRTVASCCGHGKVPGRISLANGTDLLIHVGKWPKTPLPTADTGATPAQPSRPGYCCDPCEKAERE